MHSKSIGIMITTVKVRKQVLIENLERLVKFIPTPFTIYIYNDAGPQLYDEIKSVIPKSKMNEITLQCFNDFGEINKDPVGCGGGRHFLFEQMKEKFDIIISLDDDMLIHEGWFEAIIKGMEDHPNHSIFTGMVTDSRGRVQIAGSRMRFIGSTLKRRANQTVKGMYTVTEWGPLGCLVICRNALKKEVIIPKLFVREDSAFFLICKSLGINETIVCNNAVAVHKANNVASSNLRQAEKLQEAKEYYKKHYGLDM
ncbi:glycosyltransferase family 2 protein [Neobacillus niacini]|uniref:glycosyltransferase family 2 protein n=1 Tax=Neobacillus niacini TaxID=86668 RepID=UPI003B01D0DF